MQIYLLYMRHKQHFLNQQDCDIHTILMKSMSKELQQLLALCKVIKSVNIKIHQLVHKRRTPSAVRFIEGSGLPDEGAEVGLVLLL